MTKFTKVLLAAVHGYAVHSAVGTECSGAEGACESEPSSVESSAMLQVQTGRKTGPPPRHPPDMSAKHCRSNNGVGKQRRFRREIFDLDTDQWLKVKLAWQKLQRQGRYDAYSVDHGKHYGINAGDPNDHAARRTSQGGFLPYHRALAAELETELQNVSGDCDLTIPYWNWAEDESANDLKNSKMWNGKYGGNYDGCVTTGLPRGWEYPANSGNCLKRAGDKNTHWDAGSDIVDLQSIIEDNSQYIDFCAAIEGAHNVVHCGMTNGDHGLGRNAQDDDKSNFCNAVGKASPSDPLFFLHHLFIDSLWFRWQDYNKNKGDKSAECADCREELQIWATKFNVGKEGGCRHGVLTPISRSTAIFGDQNVQGASNSAVCLRYLPKGAPAPGARLSALQGKKRQKRDDMSKCQRLAWAIDNDRCSPEELDKIPCVDNPACQKDVEREILDCQGFAATAADKKACRLRVEALVGKKATRCEKNGFVENPTDEELHMCEGCANVDLDCMNVEDDYSADDDGMADAVE